MTKLCGCFTLLWGGLFIRCAFVFLSVKYGHNFGLNPPTVLWEVWEQLLPPQTHEAEPGLAGGAVVGRKRRVGCTKSRMESGQWEGIVPFSALARCILGQFWHHHSNRAETGNSLERESFEKRLADLGLRCLQQRVRIA